MILSHHYLRSTILALFSLDGSTISFKGSHFSKEIIFYEAFFYEHNGPSYPDLEEIRTDRGTTVDHAALNRWLIDSSSVPSFFKQALVANEFPDKVEIDKSNFIYAELEPLNRLLVQTGLISFVIIIQGKPNNAIKQYQQFALVFVYTSGAFN